ncbi:MAG: hypothetical protein HZB20_12365 [Chloroflexi bacterium]|nr:hypothetical protein [Chloroflexota bacterium]
MRKILTAIIAALAAFIAFVLAVLFVITAVLSLLLFNAERQLFNPALYKAALTEQNIYDRFSALVAEEMMRAGSYNPCRETPTDPRCLAEGAPDTGDAPSEDSGPPPFMKSLDQKDWEAILDTILPPGWVQAQAESAIDQLFAYLNSESAALKITISTKEIRERLDSDAGAEAVLQLSRAQPPCTAEQLTSMALSTPDADLSQLLACSPPEDSLTAVKPLIRQTLAEVTAEIPDQAVLGGGDSDNAPTAPSDQGGGFGPDQRRALFLVRWVLRLSPLAPLALLLLVGLFGARSRRGLLLWWGVPLLIVGLIGASIAVAALPVMNWAIATFAMDKLRASVASAGVIDMGLGIGRYIARSLALWIGGEAGVLGLIGVMMLVAAGFVRPKPSG